LTVWVSRNLHDLATGFQRKGIVQEVELERKKREELGEQTMNKRFFGWVPRGEQGGGLE